MKNIFFALLFTLVCSTTFGQTAKYQLSSHILDISTGKPAPDVRVELQKLTSDSKWVRIAEEKTDSNGRIGNLLPYQKTDNKGTYKLIFQTYSYFQKSNLDSFYPFVEVVFTIKDSNHYHVPITVSPFGYSTYKGN